MTAPQSDALAPWQQRLLLQTDFHYTSPLALKACKQAIAKLEDADPPVNWLANHSQVVTLTPAAEGALQFELVRRRRSRSVHYTTALVMGTLTPSDSRTEVTGITRLGGTYAVLVALLIVGIMAIVAYTVNRPDVVGVLFSIASVIAIIMTLRFIAVDRRWVIQALEEAIQAKGG